MQSIIVFLLSLTWDVEPSDIIFANLGSCCITFQAVDTLINYETVKMFGMEGEETTAYEYLQRTYQDVYVWFRVTLNSLNFGQNAIQSVGLGICAILAAVATAKGTLTPGDFVLVNTYVQQLFQPLFVRFKFACFSSIEPAYRIDASYSNFYACLSTSLCILCFRNSTLVHHTG